MTIDSHLKLILHSWALNPIHYCNFVSRIGHCQSCAYTIIVVYWFHPFLALEISLLQMYVSFVICASPKHQVENCSVFSGYITQCKNSWGISKNELTTDKSRHSIFWSALDMCWNGQGNTTVLTFFFIIINFGVDFKNFKNQDNSQTFLNCGEIGVVASSICHTCCQPNILVFPSSSSSSSFCSLGNYMDMWTTSMMKCIICDAICMNTEFA